ncbi:MAG TPA: hypothetical protein V6D17_16685 [Candidatus Obscuribacterales bacterium]
MHKCPTCKVPLHGYEEVCPSCGTKQHIRKSYKSFGGVPQAPGINPVPIVVIVIGLIIVGVVSMQGSWIGQVMRRGEVQEDPLSKITYLQARDIIESKITEGLAAVNAKGKFSWTSGGAPSDKTQDKPLELNVETSLQDKEQRRQIIDPVKDYMAPAKIPTLTMNDKKSGAQWTYSVQLPTNTEQSSDSMPTEGQQ